MEQATTATLEASGRPGGKEALTRSSSRLRHRDYYGSRLRNSEAKRKIGCFRRSAVRSVVKLLRMRIADGESPDDFAHRANQALRLVNQRIQAGTDTTSIEYEVRFLEKLVKEAVQTELPDKLRWHVRTLDENASFEVVLARIDAEEDNYQASKEARNSDWKIVSRAKAGPSGSTTGGSEDTDTSASAATISPKQDKRRSA
ncbi:hypothetical protein AAG570_013113 [Ranatra chinensis]|uniref:Uncharacterized protein n=1 Tax=Ranatra chinensis TaxID=642074 RepID=A0ABD0YFV9_9HEMI